MQADNPLQVTEALYEALVEAMDILFPGQEEHQEIVDNMLDAEVLDRDEFGKGRDHARGMAAMGSRPNLYHAALVGNLAMSGLTATLGFIVEARQLGA